MESIIYIIQKFSDTYLLPAVTSTFIALIYFSYKWGKTNFRNKPLTIFNIFYVGDDKNCEPLDSNVLTEAVFPVTVLQPASEPTPTLSELRKKSSSVKMLPTRWSTKFNEAFPKLLYFSEMKDRDMYAYPVYNVWSKPVDTKDLPNFKEDNLPDWDYSDIIPEEDLLCRNKNIFYNTLEGNFDYNHLNEDTGLMQNVMKKEVIIDITNENSKEKVNSSESLKDKQRLSLKDYYRICYDTENKFDNLYNMSGRTFAKELKSICANEMLPKNSIKEDGNIDCSKSTIDESEFTLVDLTLYNDSPEILKNNYSTAEHENKYFSGTQQNMVDEFEFRSVVLNTCDYSGELLKKGRFKTEIETNEFSEKNLNDYREII